jgi:signal transduction histidine kinase
LSENNIRNTSKSFSLIHLKTVLTKAFNLVRHTAKGKKIEVLISSIPTQKIMGNEEKLIELFTILLDNAIKYSKNETTIKIEGAEKRKGIELRVIDRGMDLTVPEVNLEREDMVLDYRSQKKLFICTRG